MLFNTFEFAAFFGAVLVAYFLLPQCHRWKLLLVSSCAFYMAAIPIYILILAFTIVIDYWAGRLIEDAEGARRKKYLLLSVFANVGILAVFKYYAFITANAEAFTSLFGLATRFPDLRIVLPIGLSFHTFQALSYTIEVYRGRQLAERHLGIYALYVMFFPQLVAGPIERPQNLLHQFRAHNVFSWAWVSTGGRWIVWGLFKKSVIADSIGTVVNHVYGNPTHFCGPWLMAATVLFGIQIYCDFSGYTDIARGCAKVLGFDLIENFRRPYLAWSLPEFWQRWHISLSSWFRDYVFLPTNYSMGRWLERRFPGVEDQVTSYASAILVTMVLSGLWHGANWTFVVWGALHGGGLVAWLVGRRLGAVKARRQRSVWRRTGQVLMTFAVVTSLWVFFRASSVQEALYIIRHFASLDGFSVSTLWGLGLPAFELCASGLGILVLFSVEIIEEYPSRLVEALWAQRRIRWTIYLAGCYALVCFGVFGRVEFIYFQF